MNDIFEGYVPGNYQSPLALEGQAVACERPCEFLYGMLFNNSAGDVFLWVMDRTSRVASGSDARPVCTPVKIPAGSTGGLDRTTVPRRMASGLCVLASTSAVALVLAGVNDCFFEVVYRIPLPPKPPAPPTAANQATPVSTK